MDIFAGELCVEGMTPGRCPTLTSLLSLLDRVPALVWTTDAECRFTSLMGSGLKTAGISAETYTGRPIETFFGDCEGGPLSSHRIALEGISCAFITDINGRHLEAQIEPLRAPNGDVTGVVGMALDTTARLVAETALRISEQSSRSLVEDAPYAICRATESGQLLQVNGAMLEMLGYSSECEADLLERDLPQIYQSPDGFDSLLAGFQNGVVQGLESTWTRIDRKPIQVRVGGRATRDATGHILYLDLIAENVTERKELEARLAQAQKMQAIGQLAGGIAHDFNNLLTVINGYCDMLLARHAPESGEWRSLELIRQAGDRAANLTQQLLAFSRKQVTQKRPIPLNQIASEVLALSRRVIGENIALVEILDETAGQVLADAAQLHQMLMNLVINARDAMPTGGRLTITTRGVTVGGDLATQLDVSPGEYVLLTVTDTGTGMEPHVLNHLFEPFFTTKPAGKGTGLGLSTAYGIVREGRGAIAVESYLGAGTTFRVYLPRFGEPQPVTAESLPPSAPVRGESTILLVEDEDAVRDFVSSVLTDAGYTVLEASNGDEALEMAERYSHPIHLLFTDMVMPGLSGRDLAARFSKVHTESKVLFASGYSEVLATHALDPGVHFLAKPFSADQLTRLVDRILSEGNGKR